MTREEAAMAKLFEAQGEGGLSTENARASGIVVGVDESAGAAHAIRWAIGEGETRGWSLTAVLAWGFLDQHHGTVKQPFDTTYGEADALVALNAILVDAVGADRAVTIVRRVVCDLAAPALIKASHEADLLVVGARGLDGFRGLLLGSVSQQCLHHARCPVAIVRHDMVLPEDAMTRIVVGIDGSEPSVRALEWAIDAARLHQSTVEAVHAWEILRTGADAFGAVVFDPTPPTDNARLMIDAALESIDTTGLRSPVTRRVSTDSPAAAILRASEGADLVVVGSRGLGGFKGLLVGSVSQQVARHAPCPVVVVRPDSRAAHLPSEADRPRRVGATSPI
jgi:nucleotide-binding universal stress UspA family protein